MIIYLILSLAWLSGFCSSYAIVWYNRDKAAKIYSNALLYARNENDTRRILQMP